MTFSCVWVKVQLLINPSIDEFRRVFESSEPNIVYFQGEQNADEDIGSLALGDVDLSTPEAICGLFGSTLPSTVSVAWFFYFNFRVEFIICSHFPWNCLIMVLTVEFFLYFMIFPILSSFFPFLLFCFFLLLVLLVSMLI